MSIFDDVNVKLFIGFLWFILEFTMFDYLHFIFSIRGCIWEFRMFKELEYILIINYLSQIQLIIHTINLLLKTIFIYEDSYLIPFLNSSSSYFQMCWAEISRGRWWRWWWYYYFDIFNLIWTWRRQWSYRNWNYYLI